MAQTNEFAMNRIDARRARQWLGDGAEIAFIDIREEGQFGLGHPLLAVNIPYSRLELEIGGRVPRRSTRVLLIGNDDAVPDKAARRLHALGYADLHAVAGGVEAWARAGFQLFEGVNVPSKAFAEVIEQELHTPHLSAEELRKLFEQETDLVLLDSRTAEEFERFHVPGALSCPGAELAYRIDDFVQRPETLVVVSCAGRTRGIMGAQTLISAGIRNRVLALAGGTQGWRLAGLQLESGPAKPLAPPSPATLSAAQHRAAALAARHGVKCIDHAGLAKWRAEADSRTTYVLDVRSPAEYEAGHLSDSTSVPGGQLLQTTDHWVAVRSARIVLVDDTGVRAPITAHWLQQLGWDVSVLENALKNQKLETGPAAALPVDLLPTAEMTARDALDWLGREGRIITTGASASYRAAHAAGSIWANRAALDRLPADVLAAPRLLLLSEDEAQARLLALDLAQQSGADIRVLKGGQHAWAAASLPAESSPDEPKDAERIDFLFWNHDRHQGNPQAMRAYLQWERQLPAQVAADGTLRFSIPRPAAQAR
jgi:rhodanese-related sulfurtransferase